MTPNRGRIVCHLTALIVSLSASGCYIPGGGWTMRTGVDVRCLKKPAAFVELVDTRWDEYNRIAVINSFPATVSVAPAGYAPAAGPHLIEGVSVPPAADPRSESSTPIPPDPRFPGSSSGIKVPHDEPSRLPDAQDEPARTPVPRNAPTARRTALEGPAMDSSSNDDTTADVAATAASAPSPPAKRAKRPMASRLFSRPQ